MQLQRKLGCTYLPHASGSSILILPLRLPILDLGSIGQVHDGTAVAGIYDAVQLAALGQGVHQPVVQLIINDHAGLQPKGGTFDHAGCLFKLLCRHVIMLDDCQTCCVAFTMLAACQMRCVALIMLAAFQQHKKCSFDVSQCLTKVLCGFELCLVCQSTPKMHAALALAGPCRYG